jgi:hypothetical protein
LLLNAQFYRSPQKVLVRRVLYGLFNVVTEVGGLIKFAQASCHILLWPFSEFTFFLVIIKRLYFVKTVQDDLIAAEGAHHHHHHHNPKSRFLDLSKMPADLKKMGFLNKIRRHHQIRFSNCEKVLLFFHIYVPCLRYAKCWQKGEKFLRLYRRGITKISAELNILNVFR